MQARQSVFQGEKDVYKVAAWKWGLDAGSPLWRRLFFAWIFLPFLELSFKLGIPTPKEVFEEIGGHGAVISRTYRWFEDEGIFDREDEADAGCLDVHWGYTMLPHGRLMPADSAQYRGTIFPRKNKGSHRWAQPKSPFILKDRREEERHQRTLKDSLAELNRVLDQ